SEKIRAAFGKGVIPTVISDEIKKAYSTFATTAVAVRSSATAEDLPDTSFAGQQDTYLNVLGENSLLNAVVSCWSSLWTARAIGYRARQSISQDQIALGIVVQEMVESESSGVLFTANPLTGLRTETVIDATLGLGEALVSGQVEPDHYVVETLHNSISQKSLGAKKDITRSQVGGGVVHTFHGENASTQALPDKEILDLANIGKSMEANYGIPQDIEWAWAGKKLFILQSRPVTSLFPLPAGSNSCKLQPFFSFGAVQGMLEPFTPIGADVIRLAFAGGSRLFGNLPDEDTQNTIFLSGNRLWIDLTGMVRNPVGRKATRVVLSFVEPSIGEILEKIWDDPQLTPTDKRLKPATFIKMVRFFAPIMRRVMWLWESPEKRSTQLRSLVEEKLQVLSSACQLEETEMYARLGLATRRIRTISEIFPEMINLFIPCVAGGMAAYNLMKQISIKLPDRLFEQDSREDLILKAMRGIPFNVTTEMDLALWETARVIQNNPAALLFFESASPAQLAREYQAGKLPSTAQQAIQGFLQRYGMRGFGEIDMARPRWNDDPTHVMEVIGSYLQIKDETKAPSAVFERSEIEGKKSIETLVMLASKARMGWLRSRLIRFGARRVRSLLGMRESPKFFIIRLTGAMRAMLLMCGEKFSAAGILQQADDIFYLSLKELESLAAGEHHDWKALVNEHRLSYQRESRRRQVPRLLLSDGRTFYEGVGSTRKSTAGTIYGNPVSPGVVEGLVRVVLDPRKANLEPGEILVCPGTDPSWTPLFLAAGGLVMEVGGMMTHGAVVAREYGIPAAVGVDQATTRLKTGQHIRL
ncbi:MAG: phosphoenolpyruvate synthase, partial [Anaerolineaceae bacterium]|nr:phosphoenolpyruvate synthase [Anaerolineaceae bacterium]